MSLFSQREAVRKEQERAKKVSDAVFHLSEREEKLIGRVRNTECSEQELQDLVLKAAFLIRDIDLLSAEIKDGQCAEMMQYMLCEQMKQRMVSLEERLKESVSRVKISKDLEDMTSLHEFAEKIQKKEL